MNNRISILLFVFLAANSLSGLYRQKSRGVIIITGFVVVRVDSVDFPVDNAIIMVDGEKTGNGTSIIMRFSNSFNMSTEPLFAVDGVLVNTIENIDRQIERSIEVHIGSAA